MNFILLLILVIAIPIIILKFFVNKKSWKTTTKSFPKDWQIILQQKVAFYNSLTNEEKGIFENDIQEFLLNCRITGIKVTVDLTDKLLVAASAVIPIFRFPNWQYTNLFEVLLYPSRFNEEFETEGPGRSILGMVGTGYMEGIMILSKPALHLGFENESDKKNTAIHEFVHLIDKMDGATDGIPEILLGKQYVIPWLELVHKEMEGIYSKKSDINPYGGTNKAEFFAVASEYFFERPKLLEKKHPELYDLMEKIFNHDMAERNLKRKPAEIGRNSLCPCGSGKKFKKCCGR